jgi:hypothetical protein
MQKIAFLIVSLMIGTLLDTEDGSGTDLGKQAGITVQYGKSPSTVPVHKVEKKGPDPWIGKGRYFPLEQLDPRKDFATFIPATVIGRSVQPLGDVFPLMNFNQQRHLWPDF